MNDEICMKNHDYFIFTISFSFSVFATATSFILFILPVKEMFHVPIMEKNV